MGSPCVATPAAALLLAAVLAPASSAQAGQAEARDTGARAELAPTGTVTSVDGTRIAYESSGRGPVVILVSAALSDRRPTARLGKLLAERFTVVQYDRRGRGESGDTPPYAALREVEDLEALIDAAGGKVSLFGSSSGAVLALEAASRLPKKVAKVAIHEPPFVVDASRPRVPADFVARASAMVAEGRRGDAVAYFMTDAVGVPAEFVGRMREMPMWPGMEQLAHTLAYDITLMGDTQAGKPLPRDRWSGETPAALVLVGTASEPWLHAGARELVERLPRARLQVLEGQDHSVAVMAPKAIAPALVEFLAD